MLVNYNYRFCINAALQVMREERNKIYEDTINKNHIIFSGLHQTESGLQNLYFQYYIILWLDDHWGTMQKILEEHPEYSLDEKREITLFFAEYYSKMIENWEISGILSKLLIPDILQSQKEMIEELISSAEKWESNSNNLKLLLIKHKEQFKALIEKYEEDL